MIIERWFSTLAESDIFFAHMTNEVLPKVPWLRPHGSGSKLKTTIKIFGPMADIEVLKKLYIHSEFSKNVDMFVVDPRSTTG